MLHLRNHTWLILAVILTAVTRAAMGAPEGSNGQPGTLLGKEGLTKHVVEVLSVNGQKGAGSDADGEASVVARN